MSFFSYLDEEYFQLQDFLSTLIDTLPTLNMSSLPDDKTLVQTLVDQNKSYAKKVISLYQKFNSIYANTSQSLEKSERVSTNAFVDRLKEKLHEYEEEIQRLRSENDAFSKQIKSLSQNIDPLQPKNSLPGTFFTLGNQKESGPQQTGGELSPRVTKNPMNNSFNIPSPIPRSSNVSRVSKDGSFDLEQMFQSEEYKRAMDVLSQLDYENPQNVPLEKFNKWLAISNRIKDSQFVEILQKLKDVTAINVENKQQGERGSLEKGFEELLGQQKLGVVDKIYWILDEMKGNNGKNAGKEREGKRRNFETEESVYKTGHFRSTEEAPEERWAEEIAYLKENLQASETILRERESEIRMLKEKVRNSEEGERGSDVLAKGRVRTNGEVKDVKVERDMFKRKYEENNRELEDYKERYNNARGEAEEFRTRYADFERKIMNISENAEKLREENEMLKREIKLGSRQELGDPKEEDIESYYRVKKPKEIEVTDFLAHQRTPTVTQLASPENAGLRNDVKGNLLIENSIQVQRNNLYNTKQIITEFKSYLSEKLKSLDMDSHALASPLAEPDADRGETATEAQRSLKINTNMIKAITNEIKDLKRDAVNIINKLSWTKPIQSPKQKKPESDSSLREKISLAEEKLMENLSQTLQSLSKLTASLHDMGDSGLEGPLADNMAQVFDDLQGIHSRIEKTIKEFPEFSTHETRPELRNLKRGQLEEKQYDNTDTLRKKLANDRNDLTTQLRMTLQKFESTMANDALERLSEEISKNQDLQDIIEAKNLLLHRLNMLFSEGLETCEVSIRHLFELADSDDARRIVESILDNMKAFRRTFTDANAQYRSPKKRIRREEEEIRLDSGQKKPRLSKSGLKSSLKETRVSPEKSPGVSKKGSLPSIRWGDNREERGPSAQLEETGWLASEKQRILEEMTNRCDELRQKVKSVERENFELVRQLEMIKESSERLERRNEELKDALEAKHEECRNIAREANRDYEVRGREIEELRRRVGLMDRENQELRDYKVTAEGMMKRASDQVGQLKLGYFSEVNGLKEENERLEKEREEVIRELQRKIEENEKLNQLIETLQKFSNKQLEGLREKEEKVTLLANQKRESEVMARELERQMEALAQKNKKSLERAKESMDDVNSVKFELGRAQEKVEMLQRELDGLTVRNRELAQERDGLLRQKEVLESERSVMEDKMKKMSEIVEITKSELRKAHELLEQRSEETRRKDKEIQRLREVSLQKEDQKEPDYVTYLKRELQVRNEELLRIKSDYRKTLDINEKLSSELGNVKATNRLGMSTSNRPSVVPERGVIQQSSRKDVHRSGEKDIREEIGLRTGLTMKKHESSSALHQHQHQNQRNRGFEGSYSERPEYMVSAEKFFTLGDTEPKVQPTAGLAQQKDKEIQRLNQVVKDLTHSLQSSQNSQNSQIRRHIQFSSPQ